jgi:hypothetical protein
MRKGIVYPLPPISEKVPFRILKFLPGKQMPSGWTNGYCNFPII